jgi:hypothetical protein
MDSEGKPNAPDAGERPQYTPPPDELGQTGFRIVIKFNIPTQNLIIQAKCPTIMLEGILADAMTRVKDESFKTKPLPENGVVDVVLNYDMLTDVLEIDCEGPRVMVKGIIQHALIGLARNQVVMFFQPKLQAINTAMAELEKRLPPKLVIVAG